jgi:hypothetical protein
MRKNLFRTIAAGLFGMVFLAGCPWSTSPNVFEGTKGISLPNFGGPPPQTEPEFVDSDEEPID